MDKIKLFLVSILIGILVGISYLFVEFIDTTGVDLIWNNIFQTDEYRILVIPVAIFLSIIFSSIILLLKQKRIGEAETNLLSSEEIKPTSLSEILKIGLIGCAGLLAGASLGPEGVLVAICSGIGILIAQKAKKIEAAKLFVISAVGALLVGFFGSLLPILIPIIMLYKKEGKPKINHLIPPIVSGLSTFVFLYIIKNGNLGFGTIPTGSSYNFQDFIGAFLLGIFGALTAFLIKLLIKKFETIINVIDSKFHWIISASIFGTVIGFLYFIGGPSIQFSGKEGSSLLMENGPYAIITLIIILITKFLVTSWSLPAGYKGGLVFPSIFMAVSMSLILTEIHPILGGPGITIGATSGMMTAMLPPALGFILVLALIPLNFIPVAIFGLIGAIIGSKIVALKFNNKSI